MQRSRSVALVALLVTGLAAPAARGEAGGPGEGARIDLELATGADLTLEGDDR